MLQKTLSSREFSSVPDNDDFISYKAVLLNYNLL